MRKSIEESNKAAYYEQRAESAENNDAISVRDPEALVKLKEKLAGMEARQAMMKAVNAAHKKFVKNPASLDSADLPDAVKQQIRDYKPAYSWEPHPFAPYQMANNNGNMARVRTRIAEIAKLDAERAIVEENGQPDAIEINGISLSENVEYDNFELNFPGKPSEEIRKRLKSNGWRWVRSAGVWARRRGEYQKQVALEIMNGAK